MAVNRYTVAAVVFLILFQITVPSYSQLGVTFDIKKPDQYDDRVLGSEKSDQKKFTLPRRFIQNSFTHYNYFFNANNKLNEVIELAKQQHQDDYTQLLPFYNYSLDITSQNKVPLDSVIYKATTGIVLHDLRNDWIDNMYLLMSAAYYLRKDFDSAYMTLQYINYAFAEKEKDGYYKNIGSNMDGNNAFSIATKEKNSLPRRVFSEQPSRNDAFIWQIRTLIALEEYAEAASLIVTLKDDPVFPKRLHNDLAEVQALWFYRNNMHDSAALYLTRALSNAPTKREKARWEFLIAQLYEIAGNTNLARSYYEKVINHTIDPVMEIYARLHSIRINKEGGENYIDRNIDQLLKMAKRDKYVDYRDVIYYTIAQMEIERNNFDAAADHLAKSASYNSENSALRNKAYLQMAELAFSQKKYRQAYNFYDSIQLNDPTLKDPQLIAERKKLLGGIATQTEIINRQDSLQRIASMSEEERKDYVRRLVRQLRKEQGLKDESSNPGSPLVSSPSTSPDLFSNNTSKGEWYFYNTALRTKGASEFRARWGNRPNVDNWRRSNVMNVTASNKPLQTSADKQVIQAGSSNEITFDALYARLPLTGELLKISNDSIQEAMFLLGKILAEEADDCTSSTTTLEQLRERYPLYIKMEEVLFTLYYCYNKNGNVAKADDIRKLMTQRYPSSPFTSIINTGKDPRKPGQDPAATLKYEQIYDMFIEGRFDEALAEKKKADDLYGQHYWTPQLLYIEAVYHVRLRQDDLALASLSKILEKFPNTPLAAKAANLIDVLSRRTQIEDELRKLDVVRPQDDVVRSDTTVINKPQQQTQIPTQTQTQSTVNTPIPNTNKPKTDTTVKAAIATSYSHKPEEKHMVMLILNKVDLVWGNETKSAFYRYNREVYYNKTFDLNLVDITGDHRLLLIGNFDNAQAAAEYIRKAKPLAASQIIPWLKGDKYSFSVITASNLEVLKNAKDMTAYDQFIQQFMGKF